MSKSNIALLNDAINRLQGLGDYVKDNYPQVIDPPSKVEGYLNDIAQDLVEAKNDSQMRTELLYKLGDQSQADEKRINAV
jgi:hypothetical protein